MAGKLRAEDYRPGIARIETKIRKARANGRPESEINLLEQDLIEQNKLYATALLNSPGANSFLNGSDGITDGSDFKEEMREKIDRMFNYPAKNS